MAKPRGVDAKLNRLRALAKEPAMPEHLAELRAALGDRSNWVVAEAAAIVGTRILPELAPALVAAFERFMVKPEESDKLCQAKIALVEALNKIEHQDEEVFLRGVHHVQLEPRWGGAEDSAAPLRASAAFGLLRLNYRDIMVLLADLLADPEKVARLAAAQALGGSGLPAAIPLLRFKVQVGDKDAEVVGECLTALMNAAPQESLPFVERFLQSPSEVVQQGAAFALAESRRPEALAILKEYLPHARTRSMQEVILLAISMTRLPAALEFLLAMLAAANEAEALAALSALAIHRHNESVYDRIAGVVASKKSAALLERFKKKFGMPR